MQPPSLEGCRTIHSIIASDSFDRAKAEQEVDNQAKEHRACILAHMEAKNKIYNVLTPEQKKKFNENFEKHLTERKGLKGEMPAPIE